MIQRILGKTGMEVSVVGVGTWQFGGEWGRAYSSAEAEAIFDAARDCGINLIDTAECYGDHLSEKLIGEAIKRDRDQWILATKFGHKFHDLFTRDDVTKPEDVVAQLEDSLRALQTDYIDLYQFHSLGDDKFRTEGLWEALQREKEKGKIRHLGISIGSNTNIFQTREAERVGAETIQVVYNRLDRKPEEEVLPECRRQNLGVLARVPLASGFLSGKYKSGARFPETDMRGKWMDEEAREKQIAEAQRIQREEVPEGVDMASWALAWCLRDEVVTCVIPGCKDPDQVRSNAAAADLLNKVEFKD
ncbi:MAG: aldo/keto reductase [Opitutales bacterium]